MAWLGNLEITPSIASLGLNRRDELNARMQFAPDTRLVLFGFGGVTYPPARRPPAIDHVAWLVPDAWQANARADLIGYGKTGQSFQDLMASCDALVTKVGYGSFVEAAGLGLPVLYLERPDWPETPWLPAWLQRHARAAAIREEDLFSPLVSEALDGLWQMPPVKPADVGGAAAVARRVLELVSP
jgi:hypothetical protein